MAQDLTTLNVSTDTWKELNQRKEPGDTFEDVLQRMLADQGQIVEQ